MTHMRGAPKDTLKGATLHLHLRDGGKIVTIPFDLTTVEVGKNDFNR